MGLLTLLSLAFCLFPPLSLSLAVRIVITAKGKKAYNLRCWQRQGKKIKNKQALELDRARSLVWGPSI